MSGHDVSWHNGASADGSSLSQSGTKKSSSRASRAAGSKSGESRAVGSGSRESGAGDESVAADLEPIEFEFKVDVPAGAELFRCYYAQMPKDRTTAINSAESHYTPGSHHMLAYRTSIFEVPEGHEEAFDCHDGEFVTRGSYYEAQQPDEERQLPPGIAHKFEPGEIVLVQSHYINPSEQAIAANVQFILHQIPLEDVEQEAGTIFFNNPRLSIPAHAKSRATMTCPLAADIHPALLWGHMHSRGVHFTATTDDAEAAEVLGMLYESHDWSEPKSREYPTDVVLHAGTNITTACEYENDSDTEFHFGESAAKNEMCILHGMYWPRTPELENCLGGIRSGTNEVL